MKLFRTSKLTIRIIFDNARQFKGWPAIAAPGAVFLNATFDSRENRLSFINATDLSAVPARRNLPRHPSKKMRPGLRRHPQNHANACHRPSQEASSTVTPGCKALKG
ncbi:hypothetical protein [Cupriavidus sp. IK-TO18]|uniref:hypothetical protein n=1 Tax=Cupriavidus sp. IK-TO18 TaxID=2782182 RepID=UPI00189AC52A|nr:hypothetical protein [Cupriavidus sp. IK-TO18]MBF6991663.1 hypothetical protein [Cupriavidus sp. IK-TO18]